MSQTDDPEGRSWAPEATDDLDRAAENVLEGWPSSETEPDDASEESQMSRIRPMKFVHVVYRTRRFDSMVRWCDTADTATCGWAGSRSCG